MNYTLITGASSGIGLELAKIMARNQHNLILVARREDILQALKTQLQSEFKVNIEIRAMDLSLPGQAQALYEDCKNQGFIVEGLVNNAGYGDYGKCEVGKLDIYRNMLQLNNIALTELSVLFAQDMKTHRAGKIMNVGSIAAFQPGPNFAVYAASKAYVMQFTEALNYELRGTGVSVTLLSPGATETGFVSRAQMQDAAVMKNGLMGAQSVAKTGYDAMMAGKLNVIPGLKNAILALGSKTMPSREILLRIAGSIFKDTST
ncbi:MAG: SDR family NAD(P)-dependent oxidoreductase [Methylophilaceae bacterium]